MVRVTPEQAKLFERNLRDAAAGKPLKAAKAPRAQKRKEDLPENILEGQIRSFLEHRGWELTRQHPGRYLPLGYVMRMLEQNAGVIDKQLLFRNVITMCPPGSTDWVAHRRVHGLAVVERLYLEMKAPGKKPGPDQLKFIRDRVALGDIAEWFDSFDDEFGGRHCFVPFYNAGVQKGWWRA